MIPCVCCSNLDMCYFGEKSGKFWNFGSLFGIKNFISIKLPVECLKLMLRRRKIILDLVQRHGGCCEPRIVGVPIGTDAGKRDVN